MTETQMRSSKFTAGDTFPEITWPTVAGAPMTVASKSGWRLLVVYRGKHCGLCKEYLNTLNSLLDRFRNQKIMVAAVSADTRVKAETEAREQGWRFDVAFDLSVEDMHSLGLYISDPDPSETDRPFAEPGLFVINPEGGTQVISMSNAPFARPDLATVLEGLKTAQEKHSPIHGTAT